LRFGLAGKVRYTHVVSVFVLGTRCQSNKDLNNERPHETWLSSGKHGKSACKTWIRSGRTATQQLDWTFFILTLKHKATTLFQWSSIVLSSVRSDRWVKLDLLIKKLHLYHLLWLMCSPEAEGKQFTRRANKIVIKSDPMENGLKERIFHTKVLCDFLFHLLELIFYFYTHVSTHVTTRNLSCVQCYNWMWVTQLMFKYFSVDTLAVKSFDFGRDDIWEEPRYQVLNSLQSIAILMTSPLRKAAERLFLLFARSTCLSSAI